ncbi:MAG: hypothetical protein ACLP0L_21560 [Solirubrobacteraceae bacterium]
MRLNRGVRTLAAVASLAAATAPAAHASAIGEGGGGLPATGSSVSHVAPGHHDSGSTDWALIAIGAGGTVVLVGAGVGGSRAYSRRRTSTSGVEAAGVS